MDQTKFQPAGIKRSSHPQQRIVKQDIVNIVTEIYLQVVGEEKRQMVIAAWEE